MTMTHKEADRVVEAIEEIAKATYFLQRYPAPHPNRSSAEEMLARARKELAEALRVS